MTTNNPDPVNRWATEHYGFEDDGGYGAAHSNAVHSHASPSMPHAPRPQARVLGRPRHRMALVASGVLSLAMIVGMGGVAVAGTRGGDDGGPGVGPAAGDRRAVVQFDGNGGGAGDSGGGHR